MGADFGEQLNAMREEGNLEATDEDIQLAMDETANFSTAQYITHNPPTQTQTSFLQRVMAQADHPNGPGWSNTTNTNMRQPNAHQRSVNTRLIDTTGARGGANAIETNVGAMDNDNVLLELAMQQSLQEQSICGHTNTALLQSLNANNNSFDSFMSTQSNNTDFHGGIQQGSHNVNYDDLRNYSCQNFNGNGNNSISPMPTLCSNRTSLLPHQLPSNTPEHVGKMKTALMDYSIEGDDVNEDAVLVVQAIGDTSHPSNKTLCDYSKMLHGKNDMATPLKAKKLVSVYQASMKKAKHSS